MIQLPPIAIDFETFYTKSYNLRNHEVISYVRNPLFEIIGFFHKEVLTGRGKWVTGDRAYILAYLMNLQLERRTVIAHNAFFEAAILEWYIGVNPHGYFCSMFGSRPYVHPFTGSASAETVADFYDLPSKGQTVQKFIDRHRLSLSAAEMQEYAVYCERDVDIAIGTYKKVSQLLPADEMQLIDLTVKKFVRPQLRLDPIKINKAEEDLANEEAKALLQLAAIGVKAPQVRSNAQFAQLLQARGVTVPMKMSPTTHQQTFAMAKRDPEFQELRNHPDPDVRMLIDTRLKLKSTITATRLRLFKEVASRCGNKLPIPLVYYGAHTGRFSGTMKINLMNLPRGSALRDAIVAPPKHTVVVIDYKAIEARLVATLAREWHLVHQFANDEDVYSDFATWLYSYPVSDCDETATERFIGKMCILGLGYGMGVDKFLDTILSFGIGIDRKLAEQAVDGYRQRYRGVTRLWKEMDAIISSMMTLPKNTYAVWRQHDGGTPILRMTNSKIVLPNGMPIFYPGLSRTPTNQPVFRHFISPGNSMMKNIWGGALLENVVQALARIIITRAETRLATYGIYASLQVHDELVYLLPDNVVDACVPLLKQVICDPVPWLPQLPLACKIGLGKSYGEAK